MRSIFLHSLDDWVIARRILFVQKLPSLIALFAIPITSHILLSIHCMIRVCTQSAKHRLAIANIVKCCVPSILLNRLPKLFYFVIRLVFLQGEYLLLNNVVIVVGYGS